jgi:putative FmdB family regulatory protein
MPLYEYECKECKRRTEKIQKFSDPELTVCPYCSGKLERTLTAPAIQFKGGGWYKDLYSSPKPPAAPAGDATKAADSGSSSKSAETAAPAANSSSTSTTNSPPSPSAATATKS